MIIDIIVILKFYLILLLNKQRGCPYSVPMYGYGALCYNMDSVYRTPYIPLDKLYIIDEPTRYIRTYNYIIYN